MSEQAFLNRLRSGLRGLPADVVGDIVADYEAHFAEGAAAGRSEADVAAALGDPARLARELRAEATLKRWETERNPAAAASAIWAILGLGAIDVLVLLPILMSFGSSLLGVFVAALMCFAVGVFAFAVGPLVIHGAPVSAILLSGLGLMSFGTFVGAVTTIVTIGGVNGLVWYGRLHLRLIRPALEPRESLA